MNSKTTLIAFTRDLIVAMGLPKTVLDRTRNGLYLHIVDDRISQIELYQGRGDEQSPLLGLSWRSESEDEYRAVVAVKRPIQPLKNLVASVFPNGENTATLIRDRALVVIATMIKYLETTR